MDRIYKSSSQFVLRKIAQALYLLPFGQKIADHARGLQVNETSVFFWELLKPGRSFAELLERSAAHFQVEPHELPLLEQDLRAFLDQLESNGLLESALSCGPEPTTDQDKLFVMIGGLVLRLCGPEKVFHSSFASFRCAPQAPHQTVQVVYGTPYRYQNGPALLRNQELAVLDLSKYYVLLFPSSNNIYEAHLAKDGSRATYFCSPRDPEALSGELFHAIRLGFLYLAQRHGLVAIHSASLLHRGRAWLFSAPSGTGKSTHTNLWHQQFQSPLLNGDLNLIGMTNGQPMAYGIPWCGTSQIYTAETYPLGGIFLLKRGSGNRVEALEPDRRRLLAFQRIISPSWTEELFQANLDIIEALEPAIFIRRLWCTPDPEAACAARQAVDEYLDKLP